MHALPITTPSVVKMARSLFDHSASTATRQVSLGNIDRPPSPTTIEDSSRNGEPHAELLLCCYTTGYGATAPATFSEAPSRPRWPAYCGDPVSKRLDIPAPPDPIVLLYRKACPAIRESLNGMGHYRCRAQHRDNGEGPSPLLPDSGSLVSARFHDNNPGDDRKGPAALLPRRLRTFVPHLRGRGSIRRSQNRRRFGRASDSKPSGIVDWPRRISY